MKYTPITTAHNYCLDIGSAYNNELNKTANSDREHRDPYSQLSIPRTAEEANVIKYIDT